jgi:hypothetical protein
MIKLIKQHIIMMIIKFKEIEYSVLIRIKFNQNLFKILDMIRGGEPKVSICKLLGVKQTTLNFYLKKNNIDYKGNQGRKGIPHYEQATDYKEYTEKGKNISSSKLRLKLLEQNVKEGRCEICSLRTWMDKPIPLELHHIDGNNLNNNLKN